MKKNYQVFYWIKRNNKRYLNHMFVNANNAKSAIQYVRELIKDKTGRTAFGATTKAPTEQELNAYRKAWGYIVD